MSVQACELTSFLDSLFASYPCPQDYSRNGLQVDCPGEVERAAFSVDGRLAVFQEAVRRGAQYLFCHHGIFWGEGIARISGGVGERIRLLVKNDLSLYAMHLPLDAHAQWGNNAQLALRLGVPWEAQRPMGNCRGLPAGILAELPAPMAPREIADRLSAVLGSPCHVYGDGAARPVRRLGIVTGSGAGYLGEALLEGAEAFVTGELGHVQGIEALERGIPVIVGGHYATETTGPKAILEQVQAHFPALECFWIEAPTGL